MVSFEAIKKLLRELGVKVDTTSSDVARQSTLQSINQKITKCDTNNVTITGSIGYNDAMDAFKFILYNDQVGIAKEETLQSIDGKITKCDTDKARLFYSDIAYDQHNDEFKVHDSRMMTVWDYAVENDLAFAGGKIFSINSDGSVDVLFANPSGSGKTIKVRLLAAQGGAEGKTEIYIGSYGTEGTEDIVKTGDGTDIPKLNKKVGGTNTSVAVLEYDDTGTKYTINTSNKTENLIPGGSGNFATGGPATVGLAGEVLEGHAILVRVTNTSSQNASFGVRLEWWEE